MSNSINNTKMKVAAALTGLVLLCGSFVSTQAATAANNCGYHNHACLYDYDNYTGFVEAKLGGKGLTNLASGKRNMAASYGNDSVFYGCGYDKPWGAGTGWILYPKAYGSWGVWDRDRMESWKLNGTVC